MLWVSVALLLLPFLADGLWARVSKDNQNSNCAPSIVWGSSNFSVSIAFAQTNAVLDEREGGSLFVAGPLTSDSTASSSLVAFGAGGKTLWELSLPNSSGTAGFGVLLLDSSRAYLGLSSNATTSHRLPSGILYLVDPAKPIVLQSLPLHDEFFIEMALDASRGRLYVLSSSLSTGYVYLTLYDSATLDATWKIPLPTGSGISFASMSFDDAFDHLLISVQPNLNGGPVTVFLDLTQQFPELLWQKSLQSFSGSSQGSTAYHPSQQGFVLGSPLGGAVVSLIDMNGNFVWNASVPFGQVCRSDSSVAVAPNGNVVVVCMTNFAAFDANGTFLWVTPPQKAVGGASNSLSVSSSLAAGAPSNSQIGNLYVMDLDGGQVLHTVPDYPPGGFPENFFGVLLAKNSVVGIHVSQSLEATDIDNWVFK